MIKKSRRNKKLKKRSMKVLKGGALSQQEIQNLQSQGFNQYQIQTLQDLNVSFNEILQKINTIINENPEGYAGNSDDLTEQVMIEILNENIFDNPEVQGMNLDDSQAEMNLSELDESQGSLHLSDLDTSRMSGYTTEEDSQGEFGGKSKSKKRINKKTNKKLKLNRSRKANRSRKLRGGTCYGNGVGANTYDPNYSIYNTNLLKLFPYKP